MLKKIGETIGSINLVVGVLIYKIVNITVQKAVLNF